MRRSMAWWDRECPYWWLVHGLVGLDRMLGSWKYVHKFGKAQNSCEYVHQLMRPTVVSEVDCDGTV